MFHTVFSSEDAAPAERAPRFNGITRMEPGSPLPSGELEFSRASVREADLAIVNLRLTSVSFDRNIHRIIRPTGLYGIMLPLSGAVRIDQDGREAEVSGGYFTFYDTTRHVAMRDVVSPGAVRMLSMMVPQSLLQVPDAGLRRLAATKLPGQQGVGGILTRFLTDLTTADPGVYSPADAARLGTVAIDLLTAALAHHLDAPARLPDSSRRAASLQGIQAYIQKNLGDPDLSPRSIAAAHHISVSYLHRLFSDEGATAAAWVRRQRLERARRDLADAAQAHVPVHRIAARWGFADHATFTRAFRNIYEVPPQFYRETVLGRRT